MENMELLKNIFLFKDLTTMELLQFNKILKTMRVEKGETILKEGETGDKMYIIKSGSVNVYVEDPRTERKRLLAILGKEDHFGEIALFSDNTRSATVVARDDTDLLILSREQLENILSKDKDIALKIYKAMVISLADRLKKTNAIALI